MQFVLNNNFNLTLFNIGPNIVIEEFISMLMKKKKMYKANISKTQAPISFIQNLTIYITNTLNWNIEGVVFLRINNFNGNLEFCTISGLKNGGPFRRSKVLFRLGKRSTFVFRFMGFLIGLTGTSKTSSTCNLLGGKGGAILLGGIGGLNDPSPLHSRGGTGGTSLFLPKVNVTGVNTESSASLLSI
ncbi:hypothetical protein AGLY_017608 [Aphis glycines]|uniref:Uncharacterized protein n=1 Tax=Aphis glycines TaxID=307491 RepID=A0A6G0SUF5_APHGL|nr:hypothetical protein AGLY_017608 [Aphis glycines]